MAQNIDKRFAYERMDKTQSDPPQLTQGGWHPVTSLLLGVIPLTCILLVILASMGVVK